MTYDGKNVMARWKKLDSRPLETWSASVPYSSSSDSDRDVATLRGSSAIKWAKGCRIRDTPQRKSATPRPFCPERGRLAVGLGSVDLADGVEAPSRSADLTPGIPGTSAAAKGQCTGPSSHECFLEHLARPFHQQQRLQTASRCDDGLAGLPPRPSLDVQALPRPVPSATRQLPGWTHVLQPWERCFAIQKSQYRAPSGATERHSNQ